MIGLKIPDEISEKLFKISVPGKKFSKEEMHITMFYFKNKLSIKDILKIVQIMYNVINKFNSVSIKGTTISTFEKGDDGVPIIIPIVSEELLDIRKKMAKELDDENLSYSKKWPEFKPHLTLSFSTKEMEDKKLDKNISWKASEVVLWAGDWQTDPGILVSIPITKKASKFEASYVVAELFESLTKVG